MVLQDDKQTFLLIKQKASSKLKIAISLFAISFFLFSSIAVLLFHQYNQMKRDFTQSIASHSIDISFYLNPYEKNDMMESLLQEDLPKIQNVLSGLADNGVGNDGIPVYRINGQNFDDANYALSIYGISSENSYILGDKISMNDDTLYLTEYEKDNISMKIGVVGEESPNGVEFSDLKLINYPCESVVSKKSPLLPDSHFGKGSLLTCFVTLKTFQDIVGYELKRSFTDFDSMFNQSSMASPSLDRVFVYVDDLTKVETVNQTLKGKGYITYTAPSPFDNLRQYVNTTMKILIIFSCLIFLSTVINLVLSFRSFYKAKQKDMEATPAFATE